MDPNACSSALRQHPDLHESPVQVYRGVLADGKSIAVKKLDRRGMQACLLGLGPMVEVVGRWDRNCGTQQVIGGHDAGFVDQ